MDHGTLCLVAAVVNVPGWRVAACDHQERRAEPYAIRQMFSISAHFSPGFASGKGAWNLSIMSSHC